MPGLPERLFVFLLAAVIGLQVGACSTQPTAADGSKIEQSPADPWEGLNRSIHHLNGGLDRITLKPLAKGYLIVVPKFMRLGVTNFGTTIGFPSFFGRIRFPARESPRLVVARVTTHRYIPPTQSITALLEAASSLSAWRPRNWRSGTSSARAMKTSRRPNDMDEPRRT